MKLLSVYKFFLLIRFATIFIPLTGYIHPDEFFQSAEIIAGDVFAAEVYQPWEFHRYSPIRTTAFSYVICGVPFSLLKFLSVYTEKFFNFKLLSTYMLLITPRIVITLFSLMIDYSIYKMCFFYHKERLIPLLVLSTSYVTYTYHSRPFSNTIEAILYSALLYYVLKAFHRINTIYSAIKPIDTEIGNSYSNEIAAITVAGIFNRPTFVLFAITPIMFWIQYGYHSMPSKYRLMFLRFCSLIPSAYITTLLFAAWDTFYNESIVVNELLDFKVLFVIYNKLVWTPLNFIKYNTNVNNLSEHGLHPPWLHAVVHLPMLFANLAFHGIFGYWQMIFNIIKKGQFEGIDPLSAMMTCSFVVPVLLLSLFPHQEPRFLTPLLIPVIFLHNDKVWKKHHFSFTIWIFVNVVLYIFYGFLHQGALIPSLRCASNLASASETNQKYHFVFFHTYMPPRHLVTVPLLEKEVHFYDLGGANITKLENTISSINSSFGQILLFSPDTVDEMVQKLSETFQVNIIHQFWPHLTMEDFPAYDSNQTFSFSLFKNYLKKFSFNVYNISSKDYLESGNSLLH